MATKTLNARVRNKRDTSANWTTNDPVLLDGEIILVDTNDGELRFKVGDGVKRYTQLPFTDEPIRSLITNVEGEIPTNYAASASTAGPAMRSIAIPFGQVDSTSTATAFTATIEGITSLYDGVCAYLKNGVVTSASGWTLNINNLGALPVYQSQAAAGRTTTVFNVAYTGLFIYNSSRVEGGCWDYFYGYNSDTNTTAYQVRQNQTTNTMHAALTRYKICFTRFDGTILPSTATSNSTATTKTLTTESFDPHGLIFYYSTTTGVAAGESPGASYMWLQYPTVDLRYSFNAGSTLTAKQNVYIKCSPQSDGSFKMAGNDCIVQSLPNTADGYAYIYLGKAYSTYQISLDITHPIYCYKNGAIRQYTDLNNVSDLTNDSGFVDASGAASAAPVQSVNGATGDVTISIPSKVSELTNDSGYLTSYTETDPTVPAWAKESTKPTYTAAEVGALPNNTTYVSSFNGSTGAVTYTAPVQSVNGETGDVVLTASDVGALPDTYTPPVASVDGNTGAIITGYLGTITLSGSTATLKGIAIKDLYDACLHHRLVEYVYSPNTAAGADRDVYYLSGYNYDSGDACFAFTCDKSNNGILKTITTGWYSATGTATTITGTYDTYIIPTKTSDLTNDSGFITSSSVPSASSTTPSMDGSAAVGTSTAYARADHVHPTDTSRASVFLRTWTAGTEEVET